MAIGSPRYQDRCRGPTAFRLVAAFFRAVRLPEPSAAQSCLSCARFSQTDGCAACMLNEVSDSQPQLSVVVPCHNEEANLRQLVATLSEALAPLNLAYELIITDDRSTDGSWDLLKQMAANDPRLRAQRFEKNSGQSAAL